MRNSRKEENLRFKIAFTETNIRYLLSCDPVDHEKVESQKVKVKEAKQKLALVVRDR